MKLIKLSQIINDVDNLNLHVSEVWLNKEIFRSAVQRTNKKKTMTYTELTLIADDKPVKLLETPDEINNLCNFIQEVKVLGLDFEARCEHFGTDTN